MKEHICNTYIVKSNLESKKELSHTIKSRCACVWHMGIYIYIYMVANLILQCSLKIYLPFGTWKTTLPENMGYLMHLPFFFSGGHLSTHYFIYFVHLSIFLILFFLFFINNFCIATCLFSAIKLLRDNDMNFEYLFRVYPIGYIFCVHSLCRSKTFLDKFRGMAYFCAYPRCKNSACVGGVYVILILRAWQTSHKASTKLD
jgi:hypothetical protein